MVSMAMGLLSVLVPGATPKKPPRVDGAEVAVGAGLDPGNVVADAAHFPAFLLEVPGAG